MSAAAAAAGGGGGKKQQQRDCVGQKRARPSPVVPVSDSDEIEDDDGRDRTTGRRVVSRLAPSDDAVSALEQAGKDLTCLTNTAEGQMYDAVKTTLEQYAGSRLSREPLDMIRYLKAGRADAPRPDGYASAAACLKAIVRGVFENAYGDQVGDGADVDWDAGMADCFVNALCRFGHDAVVQALEYEGRAGDGGLERLLMAVQYLPQIALSFVRLPWLIKRFDDSECETGEGEERASTALIGRALSALSAREPGDEEARLELAVAAVAAGDNCDLNDTLRHPLAAVLCGPLRTRIRTRLFRGVLDACVPLDGTGMRLIGAKMFVGPQFESVHLDDFKLVLKPTLFKERHWGRHTIVAARNLRPFVDAKLNEILYWCRELRRVVIAAFGGDDAKRAALGPAMWSIVKLYALHPSLYATAGDVEPLPPLRPVAEKRRANSDGDSSDGDSSDGDSSDGDTSGDGRDDDSGTSESESENSEETKTEIITPRLSESGVPPARSAWISAAVPRATRVARTMPPQNGHVPNRTRVTGATTVVTAAVTDAPPRTAWSSEPANTTKTTALRTATPNTCPKHVLCSRVPALCTILL